MNFNIKEFYKEQYEIFSESLLYKIKPFEKNDTIQWGNYSVSISDSRIDKVQVTDPEQKINADFLFYDLLIEYVNNKSYLETITYR